MPRKQPPDLDRKQGLYLKQVEGKGRGVFCRRPIASGQVLETTPAIILNEAGTRLADKTALLNYTFIMGSLSKTLRKRAQVKNPAKASSVIMGIMAFCNHSEEPNAEILWDEQDGTLYYILQATKNIPKNTEICTSYGEEWFEDRGAPKL
jgi:uncharacterized protein